MKSKKTVFRKFQAIQERRFALTHNAIMNRPAKTQGIKSMFVEQLACRKLRPPSAPADEEREE